MYSTDVWHQGSDLVDPSLSSGWQEVRKKDSKLPYRWVLGWRWSYLINFMKSSSSSSGE